MGYTVDRVVQYANRYTLTDTNGNVLGTYDFTEVTGTVTTEGTEINAALFQTIEDDINKCAATFEPNGQVVTYKNKDGTTLATFTTQDKNVTQTISTGNYEYPILLANTAALAATETNTVRFASGITINPSTGTITAATFKGTFSGNATSASKVTYSLSITLNGGTATSYNGSSAKSVSFYAPTTAGTADYVLKSNGSGNAPSWVQLSLLETDIPTATADTLGGVMLGSDTVQTVTANSVSSTSSRTYAVQVNSDGQLVVNVPWSNTNTDTSMTQTVTAVSSSYNYAYPVLFKYNSSTSTVTSTGRFATAFTYNPYTGTLAAGTFSGNLSGNATSADKVNSALTITLNGNTTTTYTYDGSAAKSVSFYTPTSYGTSGYVLRANGSESAPTWTAQSNLSVGSATKATQDGDGNTITSYYCTLSTAQTISGVKTFNSTIGETPIILSKSSGANYLMCERSDTGTQVGFGVGSGGVNHGVWSYALNKWLIYADSSNCYVNGNATSATKATQDGDGNTITSYYCTLSTAQTISGSKTFSSAITFANNTWNPVGDNAAIGDHNVAGSLGVKALNTEVPVISFINQSDNRLGYITTDSSGVYLIWNGRNVVDDTIDQTIGGTKRFSNAIVADITGNAATASQLNGVSAGSLQTPIFFDSGLPYACTNIYVGGYIQLGSHSTGNTYGVSIGTYANGGYTNSIAIGRSATGDNTGESTRIGTGSYTSSGRALYLGSGYTGFTYMNAAGSSWTSASDIRDKANIEEIDHALDFIKKITPITYVMNDRISYLNRDDEGNPILDENGKQTYDEEAHAAGTKKKHRRFAGVSAQQAYQAMIDCYKNDNYAAIVDDNKYDNPDDEYIQQLSVQYERFVPFLIKAIQELSAKVDELKEQIEELS